MLVKRLEVGLVEPIEVGIGHDPDPRLTQESKRGGGPRKAALARAHAIVGRLQAIDTHGHSHHARLGQAERTSRRRVDITRRIED